MGKLDIALWSCQEKSTKKVNEKVNRLFILSKINNKAFSIDSFENLLLKV